VSGSLARDSMAKITPLASVGKFTLAATVAAVTILWVQGCVSSESDSRSRLRTSSDQRIKQIHVVQHAVPTATPTTSSSSARRVKPMQARAMNSSEGELKWSVVQQSVGEDFYLYFATTDQEITDVKVRAFFANVREVSSIGQLVRGQQLGTTYLVGGSDYFIGNTTIPIVPPESAGTRGLLKVQIKSSFLESPPTGSWPYMYVDAWKVKSGSGTNELDYWGNMLIEVLPAP
jgi:cytoskeletal protein RodZ